MLQLINIALQRGERILFDELNLTIYGSHKVGIIGRNGVGKSTLFELVRGRLLPESGEVLRPESWRLAWLDQHVEPSARSALDFVLDGDTRLRGIEHSILAAERSGDNDKLALLYSHYEDVGGYNASARGGEILGGLGFGANDFTKPHRDFSGGWRIRLNLAQALMTPSDLLLLDEPTNHLDFEATLWLETWVRKYQGTLLTIAHDRDFLDQSVQEIVHLENGHATVYSGNYSAFEQQRAEALTRQAAVYRNQQQRVAEIHKFVNRFRAKASKARQVQSRLKALNRMDLVAAVHAELPYRFAFTNPGKISNPTLSLDDAVLGYNDAAVLKDITLRVYPSDRIGVLGANGAGKTTLLRCLAGELPTLAGEFNPGTHSSVGYFAQHQLESLDLEQTPRQQLDAVVNFASQDALNYLGGWGFRGNDVNRRVRTFSGGEKARLVLAIIACQKPAVLILDEPTNHLDLDMREALAIALQEYQGALLLVSHDRHLLRECVDDLWLVADGGVKRFKDDLETYTSLQQPRSARTRKGGKGRGRSAIRSLQQQQRKLETQIDSHMKRVYELDQLLGTVMDHMELAKLASERRNLSNAVDSSEQEWLAVQEELDRIP